MRPTLVVGLGLAVLTACTSESPTTPDPDHPGLLRGVVFEHTPTVADSAALARFGRVVAVVRPASLILLESELDGQAAYTRLGALPGVQVVGPARWGSDTARLEVWLTRVDGDLAPARAVLEELGATEIYEFPEYRTVDASVPAYRLGGLNVLEAHAQEYQEVVVVIDPMVPVSRAKLRQ